jgi:hypothetical protein
MTLSNENEGSMIPIRLLMSVAIIAAISLMVWYGMSLVHLSESTHQVENECQELQSTLLTMTGSGICRDVDDSNAAEGTKRVMTLTLPESLLYLSFGGDPDAGNTGELFHGLFEDGSSIFYKIQGLSKQVVWYPKEFIKFREGIKYNGRWVVNGSGQSFILHQGGTTTLVFEYVQQHQDTYILVYPASH